MYAKLVVGNATINPQRAMRDIGRLLVSQNPSVELLEVFSSSASIVIDPTPSGWSYVGSVSADDAGEIAEPNAPLNYVADTAWNLAFSAPCLEGTALKYAILNLAWRSTATTNRWIQLTSAQSVDQNGVAVNEGSRYHWVASASHNIPTNSSLRVAAGDVLHVIATPQHITIVNENRGMAAVYETTMTDVHRFYNTAPVIQYAHYDTSTFVRATITSPVPSNTANGAFTFFSSAIAVTDVANGTFFGSYDPTVNGTRNFGHFYHPAADIRRNTIDASGMPRYQVSPFYLQLGNLGYPVQYVTGVVPVYLTGPQIGVSGDSIDIAGDVYTFFNCGPGFGLAIQLEDL
jgi:hypothetical protein